MTSSLYSDDFRNLIKDGYSMDLLVEASSLSIEPQGKEGTDIKLTTLANSTFSNCKNYNQFHEIADKNIINLKRAAETLSSGKDPNSVPDLPITAKNIVILAKSRFKTSGELQGIALQLEQYAKDLEIAYSMVERGSHNFWRDVKSLTADPFAINNIKNFKKAAEIIISGKDPSSIPDLPEEIKTIVTLARSRFKSSNELQGFAYQLNQYAKDLEISYSMVETGVHAYWRDLKFLVAEAFNEDLSDMKTLEMILKRQFVEAKQEQVPVTKKTEHVPRSIIFNGCKDLQDFQDSASVTVMNLGIAAKCLKRLVEKYPEEKKYSTVMQQEALKDFNIESQGMARSLVSIAIERYHDRLPLLADQLEAYALRLERNYKEIEEDLRIDLRLKGRKAFKPDWGRRANIIYTDFFDFHSGNKIKGKLITDLHHLIKQGSIDLLDAKSKKIDLPPYNGNNDYDFFTYLTDDAMPIILRNLGMVKKVDSETVFNKEATDLLDELRAIKTNLAKRKEELIRARDPNADEYLNSYLQSSFAKWVNDLATNNTPDSKRLGFMLNSLSKYVADSSQESLYRTVSAIKKEPRHDDTNPLTLVSRAYVLQLSTIPEVVCKDIYKLTEYAVGAVIELETSYRPASTPLPTEAPTTPSETPSIAATSSPNPLDIDYKITLTGIPFDPAFDAVHNVLELAGHPCEIIDAETPPDSELFKSSALKEKKPTPLSGSQEIEEFQILQGKEGFYVGITTPTSILNDSLSQVIKKLKIPSSDITIPTQSHTTFVPPDAAIKLDTSIHKLAEQNPSLKNLKCLISYDSITISKFGNINLKGKSENYDEVSKALAQNVGGSPNVRGIHSKIGTLSEEFKDKLFKNPEAYGLTLGEDGLLHLNLKKPLAIQVNVSEKEYPAEQQLLQTQLKAGGCSPDQATKIKADFQIRRSSVGAEQAKIRAQGARYQFKEKEIPFNQKQLDLATKGSPTFGKIPLTFSSKTDGVELWNQFNREVWQIFDENDIKDAQIQILGSTIHGFSRNPSKELKPWRPDSDCDLAIFSKSLAMQCLLRGVQINTKIKMFGKYTVFKNEVDSESSEIGFHQTKIGRQLAALQAKWSMLLYGEAYPPDHVDFKMNISLVPFLEAVNLTKKT